ncbi:ATP-binding protein [Paracidobacterium acidisoli]|nr:ATP-binding protein [Paracidobacterium acidisoli]MBT9332347.1 HAMP domain-containing protein [Paracidobacterium acidisoli]
MRTILLLSLLSLACGLTVMSLIVIHSSLQTQIRSNLAADLAHSTATFGNIQHQRQQMLDREVALLADLPSLKALMTTNDLNTISDGGVEFWKVSGSDLFALATSAEQVEAVYANTALPDRQDMNLQLKRVLDSPSGQHYLFSNHRLYQISFQPLYFGPESTGVPLGYVIAGYAIDDHVIREVREAAAADVVFLAANEIISGTLNSEHDKDLLRQQNLIAPHSSTGDLRIGKEHYLTASMPIPTFSDVPVRLLVLKSYDQASSFAMRLNRLLVGIGLLVLLVGTVLALYISGTITRPLDALLAGARALGSGNFDYQFTRRGVRELNELGTAFDHMRNQLRRSQQELVESARLAIIGRMASSISHDLRHYLSAIYANAEFLSHSSIPEEERDELLAEVSLAVQGMTDVLESLLVFSRTGRSLNPTYESLSFLIERAAALIRMHPDAHSVTIVMEQLPHIETWLDARMIERAVCNLLINAVQAARNGALPAIVRVELADSPDLIELRITDSGTGVPEAIRDTLFDPFVTNGKRRGIGLGLTIAHRIVQEHGGTVQLEESRPGRTVFVLSLSRSSLDSLRPAEQTEPSLWKEEHPTNIVPR